MFVGGAGPEKRTLFRLMCHAHHKMSAHFMLHWKVTNAFGFCFKDSVCELLWGEYLISWPISAWKLVPGTAMDITIPIHSTTHFWGPAFGLPARPTTHPPYGGRSKKMKKNYVRNTTPTAPGGLAPPKHDRQVLRYYRRWSCEIRQKGVSETMTLVLP